MRNIFTEHPHSIGETYLGHMKFACYVATHMIFGGLALMIHAIFPFLFTTTGTNSIFNLTKCIVGRMAKTDNRMTDLADTIENKLKSA